MLIKSLCNIKKILYLSVLTDVLAFVLMASYRDFTSVLVKPQQTGNAYVILAISCERDTEKGLHPTARLVKSENKIKK